MWRDASMRSAMRVSLPSSSSAQSFSTYRDIQHQTWSPECNLFKLSALIAARQRLGPFSRCQTQSLSQKTSLLTSRFFHTTSHRPQNQLRPPLRNFQPYKLFKSLSHHNPLEDFSNHSHWSPFQNLSSQTLTHICARAYSTHAQHSTCPSRRAHTFHHHRYAHYCAGLFPALTPWARARGAKEILARGRSFSAGTDEGAVDMRIHVYFIHSYVRWEEERERGREGGGRGCALSGAVFC